MKQKLLSIYKWEYQGFVGAEFPVKHSQATWIQSSPSQHWAVLFPFDLAQLTNTRSGIANGKTQRWRGQSFSFYDGCLQIGKKPRNNIVSVRGDTFEKKKQNGRTAW